MRKLLLSTALSVCASANAYAVEPFTASVLATFCSATGSSPQNNVQHAGQCDAYLMGTWDTVILFQAMEENRYKKVGQRVPSQMLCAPKGGHPTPEDMRAAFNAHASRVRIPVNEPAASAALNALMDAYPCKE